MGQAGKQGQGRGQEQGWGLRLGGPSPTVQDLSPVWGWQGWWLNAVLSVNDSIWLCPVTVAHDMKLVGTQPGVTPGEDLVLLMAGGVMASCSSWWDLGLWSCKGSHFLGLPKLLVDTSAGEVGGTGS